MCLHHAPTPTIASADADEARRDAFAERLFAASIEAMDLATITLGDRLGLYRALHGRGATTCGELAEIAGIDERYAREWLEQQAVTGVLDVDDRLAPADERRYTLPDGHAEVLLDATSLAHTGPLAAAVASVYDAVPAVARAFRSGGGVPYEDYGETFVRAQAALNRPVFERLLAAEWLPSIADVDERLRSVDRPGRVADIACGGGWSSVAVARAYPHVHVDGFDVDRASIELARRNAAEAGVADRVRFHLHDAATPLEGDYDLIMVLEALHDMARPVDALRTMRALAGADGAVLVMDERAAETLSPGDDVERWLFGFSVLHCLPVGRTEEPSAATGTVMRPQTVRAYATEAGFSDVEVLPIEHDVFRVYRLR